MPHLRNLNATAGQSSRILHNGFVTWLGWELELEAFCITLFDKETEIREQTVPA